MNQKELQNQIDIKKWLQSEAANMDMCGQYKYCKNCAMYEENPCANAFERSEKEDLPKTKEKSEATKYNNLSFSEKLEIADESLIEKYNAVKDEFLKKYGGKQKIKARISIKCESFRVGGKLIAKISMSKKSMKVHLALNPTDEQFAKYTHKDMSDKKAYEEVPFCVSLTSNLAVRRCCELIATVKQKYLL